MRRGLGILPNFDDETPEGMTVARAVEHAVDNGLVLWAQIRHDADRAAFRDAAQRYLEEREFLIINDPAICEPGDFPFRMSDATSLCLKGQDFLTDIRAASMPREMCLGEIALCMDEVQSKNRKPAVVLDLPMTLDGRHDETFEEYMEFRMKMFPDDAWYGLRHVIRESAESQSPVILVTGAEAYDEIPGEGDAHTRLYIRLEHGKAPETATLDDFEFLHSQQWYDKQAATA